MTGQVASQESPLILLDSGESRSVCGETWLKWRYKGESAKLNKSARHFRLEASPLIQSSGAIVILIRANEQCDNSTKQLILPVCLGVVDSNVPLAISHESWQK